MIKFFLLSKNQVVGKQNLDIIKDEAISSEATDFANYKSRESGTPGRCNAWWLGKNDNEPSAGIMDSNSNVFLKVNPKIVGYGIRPAVNFDDIKPFAVTFHSDKYSILANFGRYPQDYVTTNQAMVLDDLLSSGRLEKTSKPNLFKYQDSYYFKDERTGLWIGESPITWVVDKKTGIAVSDKILDSGTKDYFEVVEFLEKSFGKIIYPEDRIKEYYALINYNNLKERKKEAESKLETINQLLSNQEKEIMELKRKKRRNEEVL